MATNASNAVSVSTGASKSGVIRFEVYNVSTLDKNGQFSPQIEVGGIWWRSQVCKWTYSSDESDSETESNVGLTPSLHCLKKQDFPWSIEAEAGFRLVHPDSNHSSNNTSQFTRKVTFDSANREWSGKLLQFDNLFDEERSQEFVSNDHITLEIQFSITNMKSELLLVSISRIRIIPVTMLHW
ncbi:hypothetical protein PENTCL1PPCAC_1291 [Pristionchus entomophagus]|uniref:MATH domain-containing protein n=1 Tax=Pristionchus entomophagus TaxID=358040 RepID=A0AAV5SHK2_9BILA|nr:hypothetical protein PENTCL1PPCAC_1291 [Pristionchus entomophagus]